MGGVSGSKEPVESESSMQVGMGESKDVWSSSSSQRVDVVRPWVVNRMGKRKEMERWPPPPK